MAASSFQSEKSALFPQGHGNNWDKALADGHIWVHRPDSLGGCADVHRCVGTGVHTNHMLNHIYDLLEHVKGLAFQNHRCRIFMIQGNSWISKTGFSEGRASREP